MSGNKQAIVLRKTQLPLSEDTDNDLVLNRGDLDKASTILVRHRSPKQSLTIFTRLSKLTLLYKVP